MFIGRQRELDFLESLYKKPKGQLVVLYGRRRVGKTETLREFCKDKEHVFYSSRECSDFEQLKSLSSRVLTKNIPASKYINVFSDWEQAFKSILEFPGNSKKLLVIDEFPYMVKGNNSIPSILQNLWDNLLKDEDVMIILCGSSMSFIENEILAEKNPLYGRATGIYKMKEMGFYDAIQFFPNYSNTEKFIAYSVLGGIPYYLAQFDNDKSVSENIKTNILQRGSILYSEVEFLMRQELREVTLYNTIIQAIALGNTKLNDIHLKTLIDKSKLSVYLKNLIDLSIIEREFPISDRIKEQANIQRGLYRITDNYFKFWYAFVFPNFSELEAGDVDGVYKYTIEPELNRFASRIYEDVCCEYLRNLNMKGDLPFRFVKIGRFWNKTDEIDLLAFDKERSSYILGECKFKKSLFSLSDLKELKRKFTPVNKTAKIYYYLFSKSGFSEDLLELAKIDESIKTIDMESLFNL